MSNRHEQPTRPSRTKAPTATPTQPTPSPNTQDTPTDTPTDTTDTQGNRHAWVPLEGDQAVEPTSNPGRATRRARGGVAQNSADLRARSVGRALVALPNGQPPTVRA